jgi:uncharacterized protein involved in exopolysaccharide biosynthesis
MESEALARIGEEQYFSITFRDVVTALFRQRRVLLISFVLTLLAVAFSGVLRPAFKAEMKILVRRGRVDPIVSSQPDAPTQAAQGEITETELNSEVELLNSQDLLRKVVLANGLQTKRRFWWSIFGEPSEKAQIAMAVRLLGKQLKAEPLRKSDMISVSLESSDPDSAARVLNSIANLYLEKHLQVHRPDGEFTFFDQETTQLRQRLGAAEARLTDFTQEKGVVSAQLERDLTLQKASELEASLAQTNAAIAETGRRIQTLEQQARLIPPRTMTQVRTADNPELLQQMKSTLLQLELKRTELLSKFEPTYRPVQDLEKQINDTRAAISGEKNAPIRDETTDQNSTYEWVKSELAKARTDLSGLKARAAANQTALYKYRDDARRLQQASVVQDDLLRAAKAQEENYLLYLRKEEEARINDALDRRGILNVGIADPPIVPALPARSFWLYGLLSVLLAGAVSLGLAFTSDFLDPSFRNPDEVLTFLDSPVLASIPRNGMKRCS